MREIVIGDIHGYADVFSNLLDNLKLSKSDQLYLLGDYIDRGPDSKGVIDLILELEISGYNLICLKGNHEEMLLRSMVDPVWCERWLQAGGRETLESFGVSSPDAIPLRYKYFFRRLRYIYLTKKYCFVHAGLNFERVAPFLIARPCCG